MWLPEQSTGISRFGSTHTPSQGRQCRAPGGQLVVGPEVCWEREDVLIQQVAYGGSYRTWRATIDTNAQASAQSPLPCGHVQEHLCEKFLEAGLAGSKNIGILNYSL